MINNIIATARLILAYYKNKRDLEEALLRTSNTTLNRQIFIRILALTVFTVFVNLLVQAVHIIMFVSGGANMHGRKSEHR